MPATTITTLLTLTDDLVDCPACNGYGNFRQPGHPPYDDVAGERCNLCDGGKVTLGQILDLWQTGDYAGYDVDAGDILTMICEAQTSTPKLPPGNSPASVVGAGAGSQFPGAGAPAAVKCAACNRDTQPLGCPIRCKRCGAMTCDTNCFAEHVQRAHGLDWTPGGTPVAPGTAAGIERLCDAMEAYGKALQQLGGAA